jgi:hypothetical protein
MNIQIQLAGQDQIISRVRAAGVLSTAERKGMAVEAANFTKRWFRDRDAQKAHTYPAGGRRSHYWRQAATATSWAVDPAGIEVRVAKLGLRLHLRGGVVRPVRGKALALPARAEAYGRLPSDFAGALHVVVYKKSQKAALATESGLPMFWLLRSVRIKPDHSVLPAARIYHGVMLSRLTAMRQRGQRTQEAQP